jgi:hypothetical protein
MVIDGSIGTLDRQQPTIDGGNGNRQQSGNGGRGSGSSGDSLCGGSISGNGDSSVAATTATTAMCDGGYE